MPISEIQKDLHFLFRPGMRRTSKTPRSITFKTDLGLSQNFVNIFGSVGKARSWVLRIFKLAREHFQHYTLHTKVEIEIIDKRIYKLNGQATEKNIEKLQYYRKKTNYPLGYFGTNNNDGVDGIAYAGSACNNFF